jgi:GTPase SAR1 family protein
MKQIYPILLGERAAHLIAGVRDFLQDNTRDRLPNTVPMATLAQARRVLDQCRVPISAHFSSYTVHSIVQQLLQFTGCNAAYIDYFDLEYNVAERVTAVLEDYFALERSGGKDIFFFEDCTRQDFSTSFLLFVADVSALVARALQRGSKEWRRSKLSVVGEGRAGKTALTNAILGRAFRDTESTVGINQLTCDVSHIRSTAATETASARAQHWREFNKQDRELESALAEVVALSRSRIANGAEDSAQDGGSSILSLLAASAPPAAAPAASFAATTLPRRLQSLQLPANGGRQTPMSPSSSDSGSSTPLPTVVRAAQLAASVTQTAPERPLDEDMLLRALGTVEDAASGLLITLFDFGGQSVFDVIHHLFLTRNGVYAVVFNMERLVVDGPDKECALKLFHRWLSSIAAHTFDAATAKTAPIVLVGTRADTISDPLTHESVSQLLYDSFSDNPAWPSVISNSNDTSHLWFFPVSNPDGCGSPTMRHLMNVVHDAMDQALYTHKEVPISWFKVMDHMRDSERECLSLSEVTAIGARCQVSERELLFMLAFLHDMGHLMWLDEPELRDVVILDPVKYLVVPATILICNIQPTVGTTEAVHHAHPSHRECMHKCKDEWNALLKGGVLHTKLLPILWRDYQSDADILLPLMVKYGLLVPLRPASGTSAPGPVVSMYLVPALLMPTSDSDHDALHWTDLAYESAHLVFTLSIEKLESFGVIETADLQSYGFLPGGMFERVVGKALSWSQDTARGGRLNLRSVVLHKDVAVLSFGRQRFRLVHCPDLHCVRVDIEGSNPIGVLQKLLTIVDKIIDECMPSLQCLPAVSFAPPLDSASSTDSSRLRKLLRPNEVLVPLDHLRAAARGQATLTQRGGRTLLSEEGVRTRYAPWLQLYGLRANYDVFISYRWGDFDTAFTEQLFDMFTNFSVGTDSRAVEVFLDKKCLQKGQLFKADFAAALTHCDVALPVLSVDALDKMLEHDPSVVDNVLLEWVMIHETFAAQKIKKVYPIAFGKRARVGRTGNDIVIDSYFADQIRNQLPKVIPTETLSAAARLLEANGITPTSKLSSYTVFSIVHEMADFLLCEAHIHSASELVEAYSKEVVQLVRDSATAASGASGSSVAQAGDASTAASAASVTVPLPTTSSYISAQVVPPAVPTVRPLDQLSVQEVCQLIEQMGFPELSTVFAQKRVTGVKLRMCTKAEHLLTAHFGVAEDFVAEGLFEYIALWKRDGVTL